MCTKTKQAAPSVEEETEARGTQHSRFQRPSPYASLCLAQPGLGAQRGLKLECDKLASEKSEMQRHYVMYYEMSYGLNIEMHKQAEIVKRLNGICAQVLPYLSQEHQQQVLGAIERAKQVTAPELNSIIRQQLQAHQLSQLQALALPLTPLPVGLQPPSLPAVSAGTGLLSLSALGSQTHLSKEDKNGHDGDTHQEDDGEKSD